VPVVVVHGIPGFVDVHRLLGPGPWTESNGGYTGQLERRLAADLAARLRGVVLGGHRLEVEVRPRLKRGLIRAARTEDARRRRQTTPGFHRSGTRLDDEGRWSLTPEDLAMAMARPYAGLTVLDAMCGAGGNAIAFARCGCSVLAVELDADRLENARHNASVYGVADRIRFIHGDARDEVGRHETDLLFVDPPWGLDHNREGLTLDDVSPLGAILDATQQLRRLLKLPPAFPVDELPDHRAEAVFGEAPGDSARVKFLLLSR